MRWRMEGVDLDGHRGTCGRALALRIEWAAQRASSIDGDAATPANRSRDGVVLGANQREEKRKGGWRERMIGMDPRGDGGSRGTTLEVCNS